MAFNVGLNVQDVTETEDGQRRPIEFASKWSGVFTSNYRLKSGGLSIAYTANITGPMALPEVFDLDNEGEPVDNSRPTESKPFGIHNVQINKEFKKGFSLYGGIQNIFNYKQAWSPLIGFNDPNSNPGFSSYFDTAYSYSPIHGREFYLGFKWEVAKRR